MESRLQHRYAVILGSISNSSSYLCQYTTHLEHVEEGCLAGIVETEEQQLRVLIEEAKVGQKVPNYMGEIR